MSEIGIKDQCFGVEVEMTGITREQAAQALAEYFGTTARHIGGGYDTWMVRDQERKDWKLMSDGSIKGEYKTESGYRKTNDSDYRVEMVTPKLTYAELLFACVVLLWRAHADACALLSANHSGGILIMQTSSYLGTEKTGKLLLKFAVPCIFSLIISCLYNITR